jgi:hypothetical protein
MAGLDLPRHGSQAVDVLFRYPTSQEPTMIICDRCGWLIPTDCTCRRHSDELSVVRLQGVVADRHRKSVERAYESGWPRSAAHTSLPRRIPDRNTSHTSVGTHRDRDAS